MVRLRTSSALAALVLVPALVGGCLQAAPPQAPGVDVEAPRSVVFGPEGALPDQPPAAQWGTAATGHEGGEPTLGVGRDGTLFTVALEKTLRSRDQGITWEVVFNFAT